MLVTEKGSKVGESDIPNLCDCGALRDNVDKAGQKRGMLQEHDINMCAVNCGFYRNSKAYERALKDVLHCISLFK